MRRIPYWNDSPRRLRSRRLPRAPQLDRTTRGTRATGGRSIVLPVAPCPGPNATIAPRCSGRRSSGGDDEAISPAKRVPARGRSLMVARPVTSDRDLRCRTLRPLRRPFNGPWPTPRVPRSSAFGAGQRCLHPRPRAMAGLSPQTAAKVGGTDAPFAGPTYRVAASLHARSPKSRAEAGRRPLECVLSGRRETRSGLD